MSKLKTISDKLDYIAMGKLNAEQMEYICEIDQEVNLKDKEIERLRANYKRIYNENCKLRENHNINDIKLLDENYKLSEEIERLKEDNEYLNKVNIELSTEKNRLNNIVNTSITKVQEIKDKIDKSKFDGTTKSILIMALNEIIYSLNGKGEDKE